MLLYESYPAIEIGHFIPKGARATGLLDDVIGSFAVSIVVLDAIAMVWVADGI